MKIPHNCANPSAKPWWFGFKDGKIIVNSSTERGLGRDIDFARCYEVGPVILRKVRDWRNYEAVEINGHIAAAKRDEPIKFVNGRSHLGHRTNHQRRMVKCYKFWADEETFNILEKTENTTDFIRKAIKEKYERTKKLHAEILEKLKYV